MNILVIGNGFDLAHDLPTKYGDFLFFCCAIKRIIEDSEIGDKIPSNNIDYVNWLESDEEILLSSTIIEEDSYIEDSYQWKYKVTQSNKVEYNKMLNEFIKKRFLGKNKDQRIIKEVIFLVSNNFWIEYFLQCDMHGDENWIDFESEISKVVKSITDKMQGLDNDNAYSLYDKVADWPSISNDFLRLYFEEKHGREITYKIVRDKLEGDLHKLIRVFEIYLVEYVEKIDIEKFSPDIEKISHEISSLSKVICFNYTNIYEKVYLGDSVVSAFLMDYIHGKADIDHTIESNNMVLGIDEYLGKKRRNKNVEFISFKKFYQRIHKQTGCKYKEWVDDIKGSWDRESEENKAEIRKCISKGDLNNRKIHKLYIFGHSLDITDGDILRDLILNDNVHTKIFYHNKDAMGQQIANLVKIIHQDELIRRTGGSTKTIEFVPQKPMEPINVKESIED